MQMLSIERQNTNHIISIGVKEVKDYIEETQKSQERIILERLHNLHGKEINETALKTAFHDMDLKFIYNNPPSKNEQYFKNIGNKIYTINIIPITNSKIKAVEFATNSDFSDVKIRGPFVAEFYAGSKISDENLLYVFKDFRRPPPADMGPPPEGMKPPHEWMGPPPMQNGNMEPPFHPEDIRPPFPPEMMGDQMHAYEPRPPEDIREFDKNPPHTGIPKNKHINYSKIELKDKDGNIAATVLIKVLTRMHEPPPLLRNTLSILILMAGIILSVTGAAFINKNYVIPLITLSEAAKRVQDGYLSIKITAHSNQEQILKTFGYFNDMVEGLKEKEELRKSFIASLTHDLRTPIVAQERSLGLIAETFKKLNLLDEYELSKTLEKNNQHLLRIVNIILESYKFEREEIKLSFVDVNLNNIIDDCFEKIKTIAEEKNITLINNISKDFKHIKADKMSIERIFINLISNSIENVEENKFVKVSAKEIDKNKVQIEVEDNGPGIAASEIDYIFETYYTGKGIDRKLGSGLGLDVCKKLIEMHKGTIEVKSEVNKFTKFTITLPNQTRRENEYHSIISR